ncbi:hypothetical protein V6N13_005092 [Hibiscus sabdariffa]
MARRRKNEIRKLKVDNGSWSTDYKELFTSESHANRPHAPVGNFVSMDACSECASFASVTLEEVLATLFSMDPLKCNWLNDSLMPSLLMSGVIGMPSFFHISAIARRRKNEIYKLKADDGNFVSMDACGARVLFASVTHEEVRATLFSMDPLKVPSSDGVHDAFYQKH